MITSNPFLQNVKSEHLFLSMLNAAKQAGRMIVNNIGMVNNYQSKTSHRNIVTTTDKLVEQVIWSSLIESLVGPEYPLSDIGFIGEEKSIRRIKKFNFIVDGLDGTSNFASGLKHSCISIAYAENINLKIGLVYNPFAKIFYFSEQGTGAFVFDESTNTVTPLVIKTKPMKQWLVSGHLNDPPAVASQQLETYAKLFPFIRGIRNMGSLVLDLCLQAQSVFDVVMCKGGSIWDLAAAKVIIEQAGGEFFTSDGNLLALNWGKLDMQYDLISCHPRLIKRLLAMIKSE